MNIQITVQPVPLHTDADGVVRVGGTRVTLDTLVQAFAEGATPEEMVQQYPALDLGDVYATIAWYLHHREDVAEYMRQRHEHASLVRQQTEIRHDPTGIRARLLARRVSSET